MTKKNNDKSILEDFNLNNINPVFTKFIKFISISFNLISLFFASLFFYLLFLKEIPTMSYKELIGMYLISLFLLRLSLIIGILDFKKHIKFIKNLKIIKMNSISETFQTLYIDLRKIKMFIWILNGLKNFIYSIIKNLFPVLFLWIFFYFFIIIKWTNSISEINNTFIALLTMFGLLISLVQFYFKDIDNQKQSNLKLIISEINGEINNKLYIISLSEYLENERKNDNKKYRLIKNKIKDMITDEKKRKQVKKEFQTNNYNSLNNLIIDNFSNQEQFVKILENKLLTDHNKTKLIDELNLLYENYFMKIKNEVVELFKKNKIITNELSLNYILKNNADVNIDTIEHYFSTDKNNKIEEKELYSYDNRKNELYLEVLMTVMLSSLVKKVDVKNEYKECKKLSDKYNKTEKNKFLIKSNKRLYFLILNWFQVKYQKDIETIEDNLETDDKELFELFIKLDKLIDKKKLTKNDKLVNKKILNLFEDKIKND